MVGKAAKKEKELVAASSVSEVSFQQTTALVTEPLIAETVVEEVVSHHLIDEPPETLPEPEKSSFMPAKTKEEVAQRMSTYTTEYALGDLPLNVQNSVLKAVEEVLGKYDIKLYSLGYEKANARNYGRATVIIDNEPGVKTLIKIQKTYLKTVAAKAERARRVFNAKRERQIAYYSRNLEDPARVQIRDITAKKLNHWQTTPRWAVFADAKDSLEAVVKHELYHAVDYKYNLSTTLRDRIRLGNLEMDRLKISEYALTSDSEFFAEVATAADCGVEAPPRLVSLVREVLETDAK